MCPDAVLNNLRRYLTSPLKYPLLDLRPLTLFSTSHAEHATHFDGVDSPNGLSARLHELPTSKFCPPLYVLTSDESQFSAAKSLLLRRGYESIHFPLSVLSKIRSVEGDTSRRLWAPAPLLEREIQRIESLVPCKSALDIGSGCGRDAAYLAERGFNVVAVERDESLVRKAQSLGDRWGAGRVKAIRRTFGADLTKDKEWFRKNKAALLVVVRFLRRGVLELLPEGVAEDGVVVYEHFLHGCERFGGPKKMSQMLAPGELRKVFSEGKGFRTLMDNTEQLEDGRPVVRFLAIKRSKR